jgi:membrane associated rhomboid family serine protease
MLAQALLRPVRPLLLMVAAIWAVELVNQVLGHRLSFWLGLEPRDLGGLVEVPTMPLLHAGIGHVAANTLPLLVLGAIGIAVAPRRLIVASVAIVLVSGLAVWLFGRPNSIHIGASGLVFGWFGFLLALGFAERRPRAILGSMVVIALYSGMIWGALPRFGTTTSWEAHLFGTLTGAAVAWFGRPGAWPRSR